MLVQCEVCNKSFDAKDDSIPVCDECLELNSREYWEQALFDEFDY